MSASALPKSVDAMLELLTSRGYFAERSLATVAYLSLRMKFGPAKPRDAIGGVTVHTLRQGALVLKKGTTIGPAEVEALEKARVKEIVVVRLEQGDVSEDVAAAGIAQAVAGDGVNVERAFTGRSNLFAARAGVLVVDRAAVDRINGVDEAITLATLPAFKPVVEGEMIATVKLIPFGVEARLRDAAVAVTSQDALRVAPYVIKKVGVVSTQLPGLSPKVIDKTLRVTAERLAPAGAAVIAERRVAHDFCQPRRERTRHQAQLSRRRSGEGRRPALFRRRRPAAGRALPEQRFARERAADLRPRLVAEQDRLRHAGQSRLRGVGAAGSRSAGQLLADAAGAAQGLCAGRGHHPADLFP